MIRPPFSELSLYCRRIWHTHTIWIYKTAECRTRFKFENKSEFTIPFNLIPYQWTSELNCIHTCEVHNNSKTKFIHEKMSFSSVKVIYPFYGAFVYNVLVCGYIYAFPNANRLAQWNDTKQWMSFYYTSSCIE